MSSTSDYSLRELDTITDFTTYLNRKEQFLATTAVRNEGGEEDLLALYLKYGRSFPSQGVVILGPDLWSTIRSGEDYRGRRALDKESYVWDRLIEAISTHSR